MLLQRISLPALIQYVALLIVGVIMTVDLYADGGAWWLAAILCLVLAVIYDHWPGGRYDHVYFAVHLALVAALIMLHPFGMIAGFAFSAEVMSFYPNRLGWFWLTGLVLLALGLQIRQFGVAGGLISGLSVGLG